VTINIEVDGELYTLRLEPAGDGYQYRLDELQNASGAASVEATGPGIYSVLLGTRSFAIHIAPAGDTLEIWDGDARRFLSIADSRDRPATAANSAHSGPFQLRAQMPGKIIKVLVEPGTGVLPGQGLLVVEAMKMQNEMKAPRGGLVTRIYAREGDTVEAGVPLIEVE
jgi:acetyl/propionyl-CoA carboxylase alpha subunit